ncbi:helix-turn-helix domain-containing protein [Mycolicibacterium sp. XJ2546]
MPDDSSTSITKPPLARFERADAANLDEARSVVTDVFVPHQLGPLALHRKVRARFHSIDLGPIGLHYLDYGAGVRIARGPFHHFYLIQIPLAGRAQIKSGDNQIVSDPTMASVLSPDEGFLMHWGDRNPQLLVQVDRDYLEKHLRQMVGGRLSVPVQFELGMDLAGPAISSWKRVLDLLVQDVDNPISHPLEEIAPPELQHLLLSRLIRCQPNNYWPLVHREPGKVTPQPIRHAAELIEAHADEPLSVEDIAEAVGLSVRALQEGFRRHISSTPMTFLRDVRLRRAHDDLVDADPTTSTVTEIAARWGFLQPGRFSVLYRDRFGESPSATLRR